MSYYENKSRSSFWALFLSNSNFSIHLLNTLGRLNKNLTISKCFCIYCLVLPYLSVSEVYGKVQIFCCRIFTVGKWMWFLFSLWCFFYPAGVGRCKRKHLGDQAQKHEKRFDFKIGLVRTLMSTLFGSLRFSFVKKFDAFMCSFFSQIICNINWFFLRKICCNLYFCFVRFLSYFK